jgi:tRNA A-37 threonylcarbamoyl transferase component Bud32/tetratricopeptide (TPR) repeat protein/TolB-like protein
MDVVDRLNSALSDRYRVEREIGSGGMATVYLSEDLKHRRKVAIKVLNPDLAEALGADRFLREIEIAAALRHPHVMPLYDSGQDGGFLYYVMPYEEGQSLRERLVKEGELPIQDAVKLLRDVADALAHAHEQGVVHRDIKPDNVLLSGRHALVTDFGVAKAVSEATGRHQLTTMGVALGTPAYMSPEQASGDANIDHRADIYAFGALAYELLTGRPPFSGSSPQAVLAAHVTENPEPVTENRASVPPALEALVMRCLEKKPADRWQSAEELLPHLEAMATPSGGMQPTMVVVQKAAGPRWTTPVLGALAVVLLGAVAVLWPRGEASSVIPSATKIAILPLAPTSEDSALTRLGRDLVVLLSANLDGVGDITAVDPSVILVRSDDQGRPFTVEEGIQLAGTFGAGSILHGNLVRVGGDVRMDAQLIRAEDRETVGRVTAAVAGEDLGALADSTTWALLDEVWTGSETPVPFLAAGMTTSFEALRAFMEGEEAHRGGLYPRAWEAYERAFTADSTFWLAYWRYSRARGWMGQSTPDWMTTAYLDHLAAFPKLDRELIEAMRTRPFSANTAARRRFAERNPDYYPGWWRYGDRIFHTSVRYGDPLSEVIRAFERVAELNPRMVSAWEHLLWCYYFEGDVEAMERSMAALFEALMDHRWGDADHSETVETVVEVLTGMQPVMASMPRLFSLIGGFFGVGAVPVEVNREMARRSGPDLTGLYLRGEGASWAARGAWDSAQVAFDRFAELDGTPQGALARYGVGVVGASYGAVDPETARERRPTVGDGGLLVDQQTTLFWLDGVLGFAAGDPGAVSQSLTRLKAMDTTRTEAAERSLEALGFELQGRRTEALDGLVGLHEAMIDSLVGYEFPYLNGVHRPLMGRWLREEGEPHRAARWLHWAWAVSMDYDRLETQAWGIAPTLIELARVEEARGRTVEALKYYLDFLRRYDMPVEAHLHLVEDAQVAVERLGRDGEGGGT